MNWFRNTFEISHAGHQSIRPMEGIRGFAVFLVFLVHYVTLAEPWLLKDSLMYEIAKNIRGIGNTGVDLFFVLSGYLIYGMLIKKHTVFKVYILRRIQRIYPTFSVVFFIYLVLSFVFISESKIPSEWGKGVVFVIQNYLLMPGLFDVVPIITVAWSLSYEFFYYFFIPVLIGIFGMRSWKREYRILFFSLFSLFFFWYFSAHAGPIRLLMFVSGVLLFEFIEGRFFNNVPSIGLLSLFLSFVLVVVYEYYDVGSSLKYFLLYILFFIFCLDCFSGGGIATTLFSVSYLRWFGNMSYSYYLIHGLSLKAIFMLLNHVLPINYGDNVTFFMFISPIFFLTLLPSVMLFYFIEKPFSIRKR